MTPNVDQWPRTTAGPSLELQARRRHVLKLVTFELNREGFPVARNRGSRSECGAGARGQFLTFGQGDTTPLVRVFVA